MGKTTSPDGNLQADREFPIPQTEIFRQMGKTTSPDRNLQADGENHIARRKPSGRWGKPHHQTETFRQIGNSPSPRLYRRQKTFQLVVIYYHA